MNANARQIMLKCQQEQRSLTREQKEAVGLLSIGTFLEFFDFMLYVHMTTFLNEILFPKIDPSTATLLVAAIMAACCFTMANPQLTLNGVILLLYV